MTGTTRIPAAEITGFKGALIKRFAKKTPRPGADARSASTGTTRRC